MDVRVCVRVCVAVAVLCPFNDSCKASKISTKFGVGCRQFSRCRRRMYLKMNCESSMHSAHCPIHFECTERTHRSAFVVVDAFHHYMRSPCARASLVCVRRRAFGRWCLGVRAAERPRLSRTHTTACWARVLVVVNGRRTLAQGNESSKWCHLSVEWGTGDTILIRISILVRARGSDIQRRHFVRFSISGFRFIATK